MTNASVIMPQSPVPAAKPGAKGASQASTEGGGKSTEFSNVFAAVTGEARTMAEAKAERAASEAAETSSPLPPDLLAALSAVLPPAQLRQAADMATADTSQQPQSGARPQDAMPMPAAPMGTGPLQALAPAALAVDAARQDAVPWEAMPQQPAQWLQPPQTVSGKPLPRPQSADAASAALLSMPSAPDQPEGGAPMAAPAMPSNMPPAAAAADGTASTGLLAAINRDLLGSTPLRQAGGATVPQPQPEQPAEDMAGATALPSDLQKAQAAASAASAPAANPAIPQRPQRPETASAADRLTGAPPADMLQTQARPASSGMSFQEGGDGRQSGSGDAAQFALAARQAKLTVTRQETHLAPGALASATSPLQQITSRIVGEFDPAQLTQAALTQQPGTPSAAPVKTLSIRLDPPELGSLTIRMSLKDDVLQLQVEASRQETAALLQRDQETLQKMLRSAGYGLDGMTVQVTSADRGGNPPAFNGAGQFQQPGGQNPAWRQEERASGENLSGRQEWNGNGEAGYEADAPVIDPRRSGSVYL